MDRRRDGFVEGWFWMPMCSWLQNGYKKFENAEKINIFKKYDDGKPRKHAICYTRFSKPNP